MTWWPRARSWRPSWHTIFSAPPGPLDSRAKTMRSPVVLVTGYPLPGQPHFREHGSRTPCASLRCRREDRYAADGGRPKRILRFLDASSRPPHTRSPARRQRHARRVHRRDRQEVDAWRVHVHGGSPRRPSVRHERLRWAAVSRWRASLHEPRYRLPNATTDRVRPNREGSSCLQAGPSKPPDQVEQRRSISF